MYILYWLISFDPLTSSHLFFLFSCIFIFWFVISITLQFTRNNKYPFLLFSLVIFTFHFVALKLNRFGYVYVMYNIMLTAWIWNHRHQSKIYGKTTSLYFPFVRNFEHDLFVIRKRLDFFACRNYITSIRSMSARNWMLDFTSILTRSLRQSVNKRKEYCIFPHVRSPIWIKGKEFTTPWKDVARLIGVFGFQLSIGMQMDVIVRVHWCWSNPNLFWREINANLNEKFFEYFYLTKIINSNARG